MAWIAPPMARAVVSEMAYENQYWKAFCHFLLTHQDPIIGIFGLSAPFESEGKGLENHSWLPVTVQKHFRTDVQKFSKARYNIAHLLYWTWEWVTRFYCSNCTQTHSPQRCSWGGGSDVIMCQELSGFKLLDIRCYHLAFDDLLKKSDDSLTSIKNLQHIDQNKFNFSVLYISVCIWKVNIHKI